MNYLWVLNLFLKCVLILSGSFADAPCNFFPYYQLYRNFTISLFYILAQIGRVVRPGRTSGGDVEQIDDSWTWTGRET